MNDRSKHPCTDWPDTLAVVYRSEAFAEDLDEPAEPPAPAWHPLERLAGLLPLLCVVLSVADAYLR